MPKEAASGKKEKKPVNIVSFVFGAIFVYAVVSMIMYFSVHRITSYEVTTGHLAQNEFYTGLVLREESIVTADSAGFVHYIAGDGEKVKTGGAVLSIDRNEEQRRNDPSSDGYTDEQLAELNPVIAAYQNKYQDVHFDQVYDFAYELNSRLLDIASTNPGYLSENRAHTGNVFVSPDDGVVSYTVDHLESVTEDTVTGEMLTMRSYDQQDLRTSPEASPGKPVYKLITGDVWKICIKLDDRIYNSLKEDNTEDVQVRFLKDDARAWGELELKEIDGFHVAVLTFTHSMIRYRNDRYLEVELIFHEEDGLKIPQSAVVEKEFFTVPYEYITTGGESNETGVYIKTSDGAGEFKEAEVYYVDQEKELAYLDTADISGGDTIMRPETGETYPVERKAALEGVYNINKGYAVFKQIDTVYQNQEYRIIREGTSYGISCYDFIALNGSEVRENDIIH